MLPPKNNIKITKQNKTKQKENKKENKNKTKKQNKNKNKKQKKQKQKGKKKKHLLKLTKKLFKQYNKWSVFVEEQLEWPG